MNKWTQNTTKSNTKQQSVAMLDTGATADQRETKDQDCV